MLDPGQRGGEHRADHPRFVPRRDEDGDPARIAADHEIAEPGTPVTPHHRRPAPGDTDEEDRIDRQIVDAADQKAHRREEQCLMHGGIKPPDDPAPVHLPIPPESETAIVRAADGTGKFFVFYEKLAVRSEENTSELQSLMRISYA